jgi:hypothetical protein
MIRIYGDSFGSECGTNTWIDELAKMQKKPAITYAQGGTGPNFSLNILLKQVEKNQIDKDDILIFLLSDLKRLDFSFLKDSSHSSGVFRIPDKTFKHPFYETQKYLYDNEKTIIEMAKSLGPTFIYENVKNICFLHLLSKNMRTNRFLVFTCFELHHYLNEYDMFRCRDSSVDYIRNLDFEHLNSPNFEFYNFPISYMVGNYGGFEKIDNHMTVEQNKYFGNLINDILCGNEIDLSWFKHSEYDDPMEVRDKDFIYE